MRMFMIQRIIKKSHKCVSMEHLNIITVTFNFRLFVSLYNFSPTLYYFLKVKFQVFMFPCYIISLCRKLHNFTSYCCMYRIRLKKYIIYANYYFFWKLNVNIFVNLGVFNEIVVLKKFKTHVCNYAMYLQGIKRYLVNLVLKSNSYFIKYCVLSFSSIRSRTSITNDAKFMYCSSIVFLSYWFKA